VFQSALNLSANERRFIKEWKHAVISTPAKTGSAKEGDRTDST
jgi:hypothetical protein